MPNASESQTPPAPAGDRPREHPGLSSPGQFPRRLRLRRSKDFQRIGRVGSRGHAPSVAVILRPCKRGRGRVGFTVSKKVGKAVMRNRIKRRLRHILREHKALFVDHDVVVVAQPLAAEVDFETLKADVFAAHDKALQKATDRGKQRRRRRRAPQT